MRGTMWAFSTRGTFAPEMTIAGRSGVRVAFACWARCRFLRFFWRRVIESRVFRRAAGLDLGSPQAKLPDQGWSSREQALQPRTGPHFDARRFASLVMSLDPTNTIGGEPAARRDDQNVNPWRFPQGHLGSERRAGLGRHRIAEPMTALDDYPLPPCLTERVSY